MKRVPTNVARPENRFVGRASELSTLDEALVESRLVTLIGPPGVGKTRLAKEIAAARAQDLAPRFPAGVWFCDLSTARTEGDTAATVTSAIDAWDPARAGRALLVLDNVETVIDDAARTISGWLSASPALHLLVTSRERLRLEGERLVELAPLEVPRVDEGGKSTDAIELFLDRARGVAPSTALEGAQRRAVDELVRALDGLPLAIELAAARARVLAPTQILEELSRSTALLRASRAVVPRGQRTLDETLAGSWSMLTPAEQRALAACSVFAGSFDVRAAEAVLEIDLDAAGDPASGSVLDLLQALRDRSLLSAVEEPSGERRLVMLASVKAFVAPRLEEEARRRAQRAHADHYLSLIGASPENDARSGRARIALERANLLAARAHALAEGRPRDALRIAIALAVLSSSMSYGWSRELIDEALSRVDRTDGDSLVGWALEARGSLLRFLGQAQQSLAELERARAIAEQSGDSALLARALIGLGNGAANLARWRTAHEALERAITLLGSRADRFFEGRVRTMVAAAYFNEDRLDEAAAHLQAALALQRQEQDRSFEAMSMTSTGVVALSRGAHTDATVALEEALSAHRELGDRHWEAVTIGYKGSLALDRGELDRAKSLLEEAARILGELGVRRAEAIVLGHLGHTATLRGSYDEALTHYRAALAWHRLASPDYEGLVLGAIGALSALRGDIASAEASFGAAEQALAAYSRPSFVVALELGRALVDVASAERAFAARDMEAAAAHEARARGALAAR
ncbi:MAG: tetratricopeptide repeat protein, partial [Polyangiaceae bacterium]|nr:tetratricopeptide repeat protein [Polyangiaceae bacterium]